ILTARPTKACPINLRQKGFIRSVGCAENLKLLQLIIKTAKKEHQPLGVVFVDIAKVFDTVSHSHIITALRQKGMDENIISLIKDLYYNIAICIA
ncbi:POLR protein, partial [Chordeiles acutipennis]|nr:POLR protein [Chordeiles acutipennis]